MHRTHLHFGRYVRKCNLLTLIRKSSTVSIKKFIWFLKAFKTIIEYCQDIGWAPDWGWFTYSGSEWKLPIQPYFKIQRLGAFGKQMWKKTLFHVYAFISCINRQINTHQCLNVQLFMKLSWEYFPIDEKITDFSCHVNSQ